MKVYYNDQYASLMVFCISSIHSLITSTLWDSGTQQLRIDLEDFNGSRTFAIYSSFRIANEYENYKLTVGSYLAGNMGE